MNKARHWPVLLAAVALALPPVAFAQDEDLSESEEPRYLGPIDTWQRMTGAWIAVEEVSPTPSPPQPQVSSPTVSLSTLRAPKPARKAYQKALAALKKSRMDKAEQSLEEAVRVYPEFGLAWLALGVVRFIGNRADQAETALRKAVSLEPKDPRGYGLLCELVRQREDWRELEALSAVAMESAGRGDPLLHLSSAIANFALGEYSDALGAAKEAVRLDPDVTLPRARLVLGMALYVHDDLDGAARNICAYLAAAPDAQDAALVRQHLAQITQRQTAEAAR